jgi:hypothetical protein
VPSAAGRPNKLYSPLTDRPLLNIASITASGDFTEINCPPVLALGSACTINVKLTPIHYGFQTGALTINDDASDSPQVVQLNGLASPPVALASPNKLHFQCQAVNVASNPLKVALTAEGGAFDISSIQISDDFVESNDCPSSLTSFCTINVAFKPTSEGIETGRLTIFTNAVDGIQEVALMGKGAGNQCEHIGDNDCERKQLHDCREPEEK